VLTKTCQYWADTTKAEEWYQDYANLFHHDYEKQIRLISRSFFSQLQNRIDQASTWDQISRCLFFGDIANHFRRMTDEFQDSSERVYYLIYLLQLFSSVGAIARMADSGGVAYMAHVGGFAAGYLLTLLIRPQPKRPAYYFDMN